MWIKTIDQNKVAEAIESSGQKSLKSVLLLEYRHLLYPTSCKRARDCQRKKCVSLPDTLTATFETGSGSLNLSTDSQREIFASCGTSLW